MTQIGQELVPGTSDQQYPQQKQQYQSRMTVQSEDYSDWIDIIPGIYNPYEEIENPSDLTKVSPVATPPLPMVMIPAQLLSETQSFLSRMQEIIAALPISLPGTDIQPPGVVPFSQPTVPPFIPIHPRTIKKFDTMQRIRQQHTLQSDNNSSSHVEVSEQENQYQDVPPELLYGGVRESQARRLISEEEKQELLTEGKKPPQYSKSVNRQNKMVSDVYDSFIAQMKVLDAYPISSIAAVAFLTWLEQSNCFCARTIDQVVWPSLCRLNIIHVHSHIDPYSKSCARAKIAQIYRNKECKPSGQGMHPLIPDDISRIISALPKQSSRTPLLASLFLFALCTGARGDSCSHIRLCDFLSLSQNSTGDCVIGVRLIKLKSRPGQSLDLSLAGRLAEESPIDVIYWLNRYLLQRFKVSLLDVCSQERTQSEEFYTQRLWPYSTDSMTMALKSSMRAAGFNPAGFGFHSFRSGFLASVLAVSTAKGGSIHDGMTMAALITGWDPLSAIQLNYIKQSTRRNLVTTNLIGITNTPSRFHQLSQSLEGSVGNPILQSSLDFHHLEKLEPAKNVRSFAFEVKRLLAEKIRIPSASALSNENYIRSSYFWCLIQFARAEMTIENAPYNSMRKKGMEIVDRRLQSNPDCAQEIADEMYTMLKEKNKIKGELRTDYYRSKYTTKGPKRRTIMTSQDKTRRVRVEWSKEEEEIFQAGLRSNKTAREIADDLFIRTPEDVRLHLRAENQRRARHQPPDPPLSLGKAGKTGPRTRPPPPPAISDSDFASSEMDSNSDTSTQLSSESSGILESHEEQSDADA